MSEESGMERPVPRHQMDQMLSSLWPCGRLIKSVDALREEAVAVNLGYVADTYVSLHGLWQILLATPSFDWAIVISLDGNKVNWVTHQPAKHAGQSFLEHSEMWDPYLRKELEKACKKYRMDHDRGI